MPTLRIEEIAQRKAHYLLSKISGVDETAIRIYVKDTGAGFRRIAETLNANNVNSNIESVFDNITPQLLKIQAVDLLSQVAKIPVNTIRKYDASDRINLEDKTILRHLNKIAQSLNISVLDLLKPDIKAVRFKIMEKIQEQKTSIKKIASQSQLDPGIVDFFATQPIAKEKVEGNYSKYLQSISDALGVSIKDLQDEEEVDLPLTRLPIQEMLKQRRLSLKELSLTTTVAEEVLELFNENPIDFNTFEALDLSCALCRWLCSKIGKCNCPQCSNR